MDSAAQVATTDGADLSKRSPGFTLIELMVVVAIIAILAVVAVPQFTKYMRSAKAAEATEMLDLIRKGSAIYYGTPRTVYNTREHAPCQFPAKVGRTPVGASCCVLDGNGDDRCDSSQLVWTNSTWSALRFEISDEHYFQYSYDSSGKMASARFFVEANADLDCDSHLSTFQLVGLGDPNATSADCTMVSTAAIFRHNETE